MATVTFTIDEALSFLRANGILPEAIRDVRPDGDALRLAVSGGIEVKVVQESFANGVLQLSYSSDSWAFKLADKLGKADAMVDDAVRPYPFLRREGKSLVIDLNSALRGRIKGLQVKGFAIRDGSARIEFRSAAAVR
jgi:hypothetical protein